MKCLVVYVPGRVVNESEEFWLIPLHNCYIGFTGAAPQNDAILLQLKLILKMRNAETIDRVLFGRKNKRDNAKKREINMYV